MGPLRRALLLCLPAIAVSAASATAQVPSDFSAQSSVVKENRAASIAPFLAGAAIGLATHEAGHLVFDELFNAHPGVRKVDFHGIPFFAITHTSVSRRREFIISSAGFWVQNAEAEWLLTRRPHLRTSHAPRAKGVFAFDVLSAVGYAGTAFAKTGPDERDTRGMADSARIDERWIGVLVLAPALLDAWRYFHPDRKWVAWASRGAKIGMVVLVAR